MRSREEEFALVRDALDEAGLPSSDFGRFASNRHPSLVRPSCFDYRASVPVLLRILSELSHPEVVECAVRSLTTPHARPAAADDLLRLFVATPPEHASLKWAIGNALATVTTDQHKDTLLDLALDDAHGAARPPGGEDPGSQGGENPRVATASMIDEAALGVFIGTPPTCNLLPPPC